MNVPGNDYDVNRAPRDLYGGEISDVFNACPGRFAKTHAAAAGAALENEGVETNKSLARVTVEDLLTLRWGDANAYRFKKAHAQEIVGYIASVSRTCAADDAESMLQKSILKGATGTATTLKAGDNPAIVNKWIRDHECDFDILDPASAALCNQLAINGDHVVDPDKISRLASSHLYSHVRASTDATPRGALW